MTTAASRPLRTDAERNRQAIIRAACRLFADEGAGVSLEHVARVAGVGVGTVYRRFPTVDALVQVVLEEKMTRYADRAELAAERALAQPWEAFRDYVIFMLEQQATDRAFSEVILDPRVASALFRSEIDRAFMATVLLIQRAQDAGALRPDFHHSDLYALLHAHAGLIRGAGAQHLQASARFAAYALESFQHRGGHSGTQTLPAPPDAWQRRSASPA